MKKYNYTFAKHLYTVLGAILFLAIGTMSAFGQSTASVTGNWTTGATWGGSTPATSGTTASPVSITVNTGITLTVNSSITGVYNITVNGNGILSIANGGVLNATNVTISGTGTLATSATLTMATGGVLNVTGTATINSGATSTWVPPSSVTGVQVQAWSGGGGGGGASSSTSWYSAGGGAGGNYVTGTATVASGTVYDVVAGAGGNGGTSTSASTYGTPGSASFIGTSTTFSTALVGITGGTPGWGGTTAEKIGIGGKNNGCIYAFSVTGGAGYTVAPSVIIGNQWAASTSYSVGTQVAYQANLYTVTTAGTSTSTPPTNTSGASSAGTTGAVFTYAGAAAFAYASLSSGAVSYVAFNYSTGATGSSSTSITNGSGYTSAPAITFGYPAWQANTYYYAGSAISYGGYVYSVGTAGTSNTTAPTNTSGTSSGTGVIFTYAGALTTLNSAIITAATATAFVNPITITGATTSYLGGNGGNGVYTASTSTNSSGGGGGSASSSANGTAGNNAVAGTGGAAVAGGLSGNSGAGATTAATTGTVGGAATGIGNGGGGATSQSKAGGVGSPGQVILSYTSLTLTGTLGALSTTYGTASSTTSFAISSPSNLFSNITVTPPAGFEVSTASDFSSNVGTSSAGSTVSSGASFPVTIYVRLAATASVASSPFSGSITVASTGYSASIATASSTVNKATLTVTSGITANNKAFDNGTTATFSYGSAVLSGYQNSDGSSNVSISAVAGTFASVGVYNATTSNIAVTISSITLGGAAGGNYQITSFPSLTANITPTVSPTVIIGSLGNGGTFGNVTVGDAPTTTFTLTTLNLSGVTTSITAPSGYTVSPTSVTGNASTTITVTFTPSSATSFSGNISGAATGATTATSAVSGTGLAITSPGTSTALNIQYTSDNTQQLNWSAPTGSCDGVLIFQSTSSGSYTPSGAGSAYTVGTAYSGYTLVAAGSSSATSAVITGLTNGNHYYYQIFSYAGSNYSAGASSTIVNGTTAVSTVSSLGAVTTTGKSVLSWTNPSSTRAGSPDYFWDSVLVIAYPTSGSISAPTGNGSSYVPNASYGLGTSYGSGYVVYNGTGTGVTVTQLPNLVGYTFAAYVRHGSAWSSVQTTTGTPTYAVGDYVSIATGSYYIASNTVWGIWNGTTAVSTTSSPGSGNNVWVVNGFKVTVTTTGSSTSSTSTTNANCNNLYVIGTNSTLVGANTLGSTNPVVVNGTNIEVSSGGTVGVYSAAGTTSSASGNNANGISFFIDNTGTTTIYGNAGNIDLGKIAIAASGDTLAIDESLTIHYHGTSNGGGANGLIVNNSSSTFSYNNNVVTINNGATVTMDRWSSIGLSSSNQTFGGVTPGTPYAQTFTLNVNGTLTFLKGMPDGQTTNTQTYSNNGFLSFMTSTVNGATLNVGSTGTVNLEEFYPNGWNTSNNGGLGSSTTCVINIASGGSLNVDSIADFRNASQTISGSGTFQLNSTMGNRIKIGSTSGIDGIFSGFTGTKNLPSTNVMYSYEGTAAQVTGASLPATVSGLRVDNSSGITLSQSTTVNDTLRLDYGLLNTSTQTLTLGATIHDIVSTASSNTSYVNGNLSIVSAASQSLYFPIGNSSVYSPVTLNVTQSGTVTYAGKVTTGSAIGYSTGSSTISGISPNRYYKITSSGGSVSAAYITLGYNNNAADDGSNGSFNTTVGSRVRVIGSANSSSALNDLGGSASIISTGVGTITSATSFPSLGNFAIGEELSTTQTPPTLTASGSATVAGNYNITYTDPSGTWTSAITSLTFNGTTLSKTSSPADYSITNISGNNYEITIMPHGTTGALLRTSGTFIINVVATNYDDNTVDQAVGTGLASQLVVHTAPGITNNAAAFTTQPVIYITDAYSNLVTTATDNIKVTSTGSNASSWTLAGTTTVAASGGIATFTNLSASSNTQLNISFLFTSQNSSPNNYGTATANNINLPTPPTYYWVGGSTAASSWTNSGLWSTTRGGSAVTPTFSKSTILIFDGSSYGTPATGSINTAGTSTTTADTIAQIILVNGAVVNLNQSSGVIKYGLAGNYYGSGLTIDATSKLSIIPLAGTDTMMLLAGATADIYGTVVLGNANQESLVAKSANAIKFYNGSKCTVNQSTGANPFGNATYGEPSGSVVFNNGASLYLNPKTLDVFGGNNIVTFGPTSNYYIEGGTTSGNSEIFDGHSFGNIIINNGTLTNTPASAGASGFTCTSLSVLSGTFNMNETGGTNSLGAISVSSGATLNLTSAPTYSSISNSGTINFLYTSVALSGTIGGTVGFTGTAAAQTLNASPNTGNVLNLTNLTINNTATTSPSVTVYGTLNISGILTVTANNLNLTSSTTTLKSTSIANSAVVGQAGSTASITGTATVERYIPAGYRGYRDMAPQVYGAGSIYNNWQEGGSLTHNGYGIFITGPSSTDATVSDYNAGQIAANSSTGLDYSLNGLASAFTYNNLNDYFYSRYVAGQIDSIWNTKTFNLDPFQGYRVLVRGDRSFNLAQTPILNYPAGLRMYNSTTIRATGNLVYGTVTYSTTGVTGTANGGAITSTNGLSPAQTTFVTSNGKSYIATGLSMVANPYDCPVSWTSVYNNSHTAGSDINGTWYFLDPTYGEKGTYEAYNYSSGSQYSDEANASDLIQAGQAFFVLNSTATTPTPKVVFQEAAKQATSTKLSIFGATTPLSKIYVELYKGTSRTDGVAIAFRNDFTNNNVGTQDAYKLGGGSDNIAISDKGIELGIDGRLPATATDAIALKIGSPTTTTYQLNVNAANYIDNGFLPLLYDAYKNTTTSLGSGVTTVDFTVDSKTAATYANRFSIIFTPSALAVNSIVASATLNNKIATITWNTVGEKGESRFEVEKSTDGKTFSSIGQQAAKNTSTASYTATDNSVVEGNNYYRIKAVNVTGAVNYSNIAKLTTNNSQLITVYPNPLVGKTLNVQVTNVAAGKYVVSIYNVLGEKVAEQSIAHSGGSATHALTINKTLAGGVYSVVIRAEGSNQIVHQTSLSVQP